MTSDHPGRRALRGALWRAALTLAVTIGLVAAVDRDARILGPALIVVGAYGGAKALHDWWRHLDAEWFLAETVLVTLAWAMFAGAFAAIQYVAFAVAPDAFYVDTDYAKLAAPRYRAGWVRDSSRAAATQADLDRAAALVAGGARRSLVLDSVYDLGQGASGQLAERCEEQLPMEQCRWQLVVVPAPGSTPIVIPLRGPGGDQRTLTTAELRQQLGAEQARVRQELAELDRRLADPAGFVQPRIVDFLYDTGIAFSGNDAGVFVPISPLARFCKVVELLASLLLFGIVVSRISAAASSRPDRSP
jgi:hypothetical protein